MLHENVDDDLDDDDDQENSQEETHCCWRSLDYHDDEMRRQMS